jgi:hypothetical protein
VIDDPTKELHGEKATQASCHQQESKGLIANANPLLNQRDVDGPEGQGRTARNKKETDCNL